MNQEVKETKKLEFTQGQAVKAHWALEKLYNQDIPSIEAFDVYMMIQQLEPIAAFQRDQHQRITMDMKPKIENDGKTLDFGTPERLQEYKDKINKLEEMPLEIKIEPVRVQLSQNIIIAPADIAVLKGFIEFYK